MPVFSKTENSVSVMFLQLSNGYINSLKTTVALSNFVVNGLSVL